MVIYYKVPPSFNNLSGSIGYVLNIYTFPEARNQGIAHAVVRTILDECRERSVKVVRLRASRFGRPIYEKFGFTVKESEMELKLDA